MQTLQLRVEAESYNPDTLPDLLAQRLGEEILKHAHLVVKGELYKNRATLKYQASYTIQLIVINTIGESI